MWLSQLATPQRIGQPLTPLPGAASLFKPGPDGLCDLHHDKASWALHAGEAEYNLLNPCCPTAHTPWDPTHGQEAPRLTPHGTPPTGKRPHGSHPMGPHPWARGPTDHTPWDPTHGQWGYRLSRWGCHFPGRVSRSQQTSLWQRQ
jgi:hypothetical protein